MESAAEVAMAWVFRAWGLGCLDCALWQAWVEQCGLRRRQVGVPGAVQQGIQQMRHRLHVWVQQPVACVGSRCIRVLILRQVLGSIRTLGQ